MARFKKKHGAFGTKEYITWGNMLQRCRNPKHRDYHRYGGRGITVCKRWSSFENFIADMGMAPLGRRISIEREDNEEGYEPDNCKWATPKQQAQNRRKNPMYKLTKEQHEEIRVLGGTMTQVAIAKRFGVDPSHISRLLNRKEG